MQLPNVYAQGVKKQPIDMTLSVNPLGCSPLVARMLISLTASDISTYPDATNLIQSIAKRFDIDPESIVLGNGSEQLIKLIAQTFLMARDTVLVPRGSFVLFTKESQIKGASVRFVDIEDLMCIKKKPRLVFLANPSTPTGETMPLDKLQQIIRRLEPALVVVDEANGEFSKESLVRMSTVSKNLIVLRTFSKAMGLAGLRVAFATSTQTRINLLKEVQQPFPVSSVAVSLAVAALSDQRFIDKTISFVANERSFLTKKLVKLGLTISNSMTNNLFIGSPNAEMIITELRKRGVSVINGTFFPGMKQKGFRISIKDRKTNLLFLKRITEVLACIPKKNLLRSKEVL